jgi:alpha-ketoglutarate-dependent taurine dioxygenase
MEQNLLEASARLRAAQAALGEAVRVSEPFPGRPPLWIEPLTPALREDIAAAAAWIVDRRAAIEQALLEFGAVLWRGFPVAESQAFERLLGSFTPFSRGYAGGVSDRKTVSGQVMEATRTPPEVYILIHQEMSYLPASPRLLAFFCRQPAASGGETVICDMRGMLEALPAGLRRKLIDEGVHYIRNLRSDEVDDWRAEPVYRHHAWQYWYDTRDRREVERQVTERGMSFQWKPDGSLKTWTAMPGVTTHPVTGELLFYNQIYAQRQHRLSVGEARAALLDEGYPDPAERPFVVAFGGGAPLSEAEFAAIHDELERRKVVFPWRSGDVMLVENRLTAHGRHPYAGERDVQVMLFE